MNRSKCLQNSVIRSLDILFQKEGPYNRWSPGFTDVDKKIEELFQDISFGELSPQCILSVRKYFNNTDESRVCFGLLYLDIEQYLRAPDISQAMNLFTELENKFRAMRDFQRIAFTDKRFVKAVYLSASIEIIELINRYLPRPPLSMFNPDEIPECLIKNQREKIKCLSDFKMRNFGNNNSERKVVYLQRYIRSYIRQKTEVIRIANRQFEGAPDATVLARQLIHEANAPYQPQKCRPELAKRLMAMASQITLFSSVSHVLDATKLAVILDGCLLGRQNLIHSYQSFRPAALASADMHNGDYNVICLGPDKIDPICYQGRSVTLELDVDALIDKRKQSLTNPTLFFKQMDLQYIVDGTQSLVIKNLDEMTFSHTGPLRMGDFNYKNQNLQIFNKDNELQWFSEVKNDYFISYNMSQMHEILIMNFFRFLDNLKVATERTTTQYPPVRDEIEASEKIAEIYAAIEKLDDEELRAFLEDLGKKVSCSCEFNIYGGYQIDMKALRSLSLYQESQKVGSVSITDLLYQLDHRNFELFGQLKGWMPEILTSQRFVDYIASQLHNSASIQAFRRAVQLSIKKPPEGSCSIS